MSLDLNDQVIFKEARVQGITGREMFRTWQQTTTLLSTGRVDVTPVITDRFTLDRFEDAFARTASGGAGKVDPAPAGLGGRCGRRALEIDAAPHLLRGRFGLGLHAERQPPGLAVVDADHDRERALPIQDDAVEVERERGGALARRR